MISTRRNSFSYLPVNLTYSTPLSQPQEKNPDACPKKTKFSKRK